MHAFTLLGLSVVRPLAVGAFLYIFDKVVICVPFGHVVLSLKHYNSAGMLTCSMFCVQDNSAAMLASRIFRAIF